MKNVGKFLENRSFYPKFSTLLKLFQFYLKIGATFQLFLAFITVIRKGTLLAIEHKPSLIPGSKFGRHLL